MLDENYIFDLLNTKSVRTNFAIIKFSKPYTLILFSFYIIFLLIYFPKSTTIIK